MSRALPAVELIDILEKEAIEALRRSATLIKE